MSHIAPVLRHALRGLTRTPAASALAVATMAAAIGANTAIFSVVYTTVLKPLPYPAPDELVTITSEFPSIRLKAMGLSGPEVVELRRFTRSWSFLGAVHFDTATLGGAEPRPVSAAVAGADVLTALGVAPLMGRVISAEDDRGVNGQVVLLSNGIWHRVFGADPALVGRAIDIDGESRTVIGVMPPGFDLLGNDTDLWLPLGLDPAAPGARADHTYRVIARLASGTTLAQAAAELEAVTAQWMANTGELHSPAPRFHPLAITPLGDVARGDLRRTMLILLGSVGFVLLLACANVANLLIARAEGARHQLAVRIALGASRRRLALDHLTEGLCLAAAGCGGGLLLAYGLSQTLIAAAPMLPRHQPIAVDLVVLGFCALVSGLSGVLFGLAPLVRLDVRRAHGWLRSDARGTSSSRDRKRLQHAIVAVQLALALTLLAGAGALLQSFWRLAGVDPGIRPDDVIIFQVSLPERRFDADAEVWSLYENLLDRLRGLPGVRSAAAMSGRLPQRRANNTTFFIEGLTVQGHDGMPQVEFIQHVTPDYFLTLGVSLLKARPLDSSDTERAEPVALVNETLARKFWGDRNPIGLRLRPALQGTPWVTVVGVVSDVKHAGLAAPAGTELYVTHRQSRLLLPGWLPSSMHVVVRPAPDRTDPVLRSVTRLVQEVDPRVAVANLRPLSEALAASISGPAFMAQLITAFAVFALLLAAVGVYGVIACGVSQRTTEFGVRMALGASPRSVLWLVLKGAAVPVMAGIVLGLAGAIWSGRLLMTLVFLTRPGDPATLAAVVVVLVAVALAACWIPARRATRVDPLDALRTW